MVKTKLYTTFFSCLLLSLAGYIIIGYATDRTSFYRLIGLYTGLHLLYFYSYKIIRREELIVIPLLAAFLFRITQLFYFPNLSDDFYRFLWDGRLLVQGINPYDYMPSELIGSKDLLLDNRVYEQLNSQNYYSVYPPINQFVFFLSTLLFPHNSLGTVIMMKSVILLFEIGSAWFLLKLLTYFKLNKTLVFLYLLNPLVIIELTGNLHFEAGMIFFVLGALYFAVKNKVIISSFFISLAIATKLWPIVSIPFFLKRFGWNKLIFFIAFTSTFILIWFFPFYNETFIPHFLSSISLYFSHFEFNGSICYFIKWLGCQTNDQNLIETVGVILPLTSFSLIMLMFLIDKGKNWLSIFQLLLFSLVIYFLFSTTVHPWYITPLLAFAIFSKFRFPFIWALFIPLTYITYVSISYKENMIFIFIEYLGVVLFYIYEFSRKANINQSSDKS